MGHPIDPLFVEDEPTYRKGYRPGYDHLPEEPLYFPDTPDNVSPRLRWPVVLFFLVVLGFALYGLFWLPYGGW